MIFIKLSKKDALICLVGGILISMFLFGISFLVKPSIITNELYWLAIGLLPMVILVLIKGYKLEKEMNEEDEFKD